jgi:hypothetical protein
VTSVPRAYLRWLRRQPGASNELRQAIGPVLGIKPKTATVHHRRPVFDGRRAAAGDRD